MSEPVDFRIPFLDSGTWQVVFDTSLAPVEKARDRFGPRRAYPLGPRSVVVLRRPLSGR